MPNLPRLQEPQFDRPNSGDSRRGKIPGITAVRRGQKSNAGGRPEGRDHANAGRIHSIAGGHFVRFLISPEYIEILHRWIFQIRVQFEKQVPEKVNTLQLQLHVWFGESRLSDQPTPAVSFLHFET